MKKIITHGSQAYQKIQKFWVTLMTTEPHLHRENRLLGES